MTVDESYSDEYGKNYGLLICGETDEDPILSITKEVENDTSYTWVAYNIDLAAGSVTFTGTPTSDLMTLTSQTAYALDFGLPSPVLPGQTVSFSFDILIPTGGPFSFTLTQTPELVPEPASTALVGLAVVALALVGRKRIL
jgi:hypothetical protein